MGPTQNRDFKKKLSHIFAAVMTNFILQNSEITFWDIRASKEVGVLSKEPLPNQ